MPNLPPKACSYPRCGAYSVKGGRCEEHKHESWSHTKSPTERGYGNDWRVLRQQVLSRDNFLCQHCRTNGVYTPATDVDHIKPKFEGGTNAMINLQSLCKACHRAKSKQESARARA